MATVLHYACPRAVPEWFSMASLIQQEETEHADRLAAAGRSGAGGRSPGI